MALGVSTACCGEGGSKGLIPAMDGCGTALFCVAITALDIPFGRLQEISAGPSSPGRLLEHLPTCQEWQPEHKLFFPHLAP